MSKNNNNEGAKVGELINTIKGEEVITIEVEGKTELEKARNFLRDYRKFQPYITSKITSKNGISGDNKLLKKFFEEHPLGEEKKEDVSNRLIDACGQLKDEGDKITGWIKKILEASLKEADGIDLEIDKNAGFAESSKMVGEFWSRTKIPSDLSPYRIGVRVTKEGLSVALTVWNSNNKHYKNKNLEPIINLANRLSQDEHFFVSKQKEDKSSGGEDNLYNRTGDGIVPINIFYVFEKKDGGIPKIILEDGSDDDIKEKVTEAIEVLYKKYEEIVEYNYAGAEINKIVCAGFRQVILTGAPGTGKTYGAQKYAEKWNTDSDGNQLSDDRKHYEVIQFHPSYDYTDFVEGIRPVQENQKNEISFVKLDGQFKSFCRKVVNESMTRYKNKMISDKIEGYDANVKKVIEEKNDNTVMSKEDFLNNALKLLDKIDGNEEKVDEEKDDNKDTNSSDISFQSIDWLKLKEYENNDDDKSKEILVKIPDILKEIEKIILDEEVKKEERKNPNFEFDSNNKGVVDKLWFEKLVDGFDSDEWKNKKFDDAALDAFCGYNKDTNEFEELYVFIIDEINRADISKVMGELMYLLEYRGVENRMGSQYQNLRTYDLNKQDYLSFDCFSNGFFIPENVLIVGTMNDIDKSVESFDFAMRRRFRWSEIKMEETALCEALKGILSKDKKENKVDYSEEIRLLGKQIDNMNKTMITYNSRAGLTEAYYIGPAFFVDYRLNNKNKEGWKKELNETSLKEIFDYNIEPLLKEYVRGRNIDENKFVEACETALFSINND